MLRRIENVNCKDENGLSSTIAVIQKAVDNKGNTLAYSVAFADGTTVGNIPRLGEARAIAVKGKVQQQEAA